MTKNGITNLCISKIKIKNYYLPMFGREWLQKMYEMAGEIGIDNTVRELTSCAGDVELLIIAH